MHYYTGTHIYIFVVAIILCRFINAEIHKPLIIKSPIKLYIQSLFVAGVKLFWKAKFKLITLPKI